MPRLLLSSITLAAALSFTLPLAAQAAYVGPSVMKEKSSVRDVLDKPVDGQPVKLQGKLLRQTAKSLYLFSDGSAEITVEIDAEDFPREPVDENTEVLISGEVDTGLKRPPKIEVEQISIVQ
ncbi:NirD/YgiW/YdeI family stress tolerance protein [Pusillimonas sp. CC-YST705]|uniref:NirD/YgiW/YdeI family stress tolerance protein n=1 Tax=Mesopusillimonas faecipullorum TaxID=2755040 RepID=A0ABS8CA33_9BURK|nr:NirD/YgiW/YdeI family stress tolerance protein [Mesopusillimonas faecipullorum]MCB5362873.1 NirD/YgiW/YdeI family stress tolerance protein [Mesopusillimonas faecipullorum]